MAKNENGYESLLASLIVDIKSYSGKDHLLPWIRGIKKMKECLPPQILNENLPRFLQKCAQSFESDKRYHNDSRYIRLWLQLMILDAAAGFLILEDDDEAEEEHQETAKT